MTSNNNNDPVITLLLIVLAVFMPPLAVALKDGLSVSFWLNILFTLLGFWIVGVIHAVYVIAFKDK